MLISNAWAQATLAAPAAANDPFGGLMGVLPMVAIGGVFWFLAIRPQMKRAKEQKALLETIQKGDEVVTNGGVAGRVTKVGENYIGLEVSDNVEITVQKGAITNLLPKGTLKTL